MLLTFQTTQRVMRAERLLKGAGIQTEPRVTPNQLSTECGICLSVTNGDMDRAVALLDSENLQPGRIFDEKSGKKR